MVVSPTNRLARSGRTAFIEISGVHQVLNPGEWGLLARCTLEHPSGHVFFVLWYDLFVGENRPRGTHLGASTGWRCLISTLGKEISGVLGNLCANR